MSDQDEKKSKQPVLRIIPPIHARPTPTADSPPVQQPKIDMTRLVEAMRSFIEPKAPTKTAASTAAPSVSVLTATPYDSEPSAVRVSSLSSLSPGRGQKSATPRTGLTLIRNDDDGSSSADPSQKTGPKLPGPPQTK